MEADGHVVTATRRPVTVKPSHCMETTNDGRTREYPRRNGSAFRRSMMNWVFMVPYPVCCPVPRNLHVYYGP